MRLPGLTDPIATRWSTAWREGDVGAIARNYVREGMDLVHPRIDWRRDGPGFVESEFPIAPYAIAVADSVFGMHDVLARLVSAATSVAAFYVFVRIARRILSPGASFLACLLVASNPALFQIANSVQPEPLLVLTSLLALDRLLQWDADPRAVRLIAACAWLAAAVLAKATAAHLGLVFAFAVLRKLGRGCFRRREVWAGAALALAPPLLWYSWSHGFWVRYGNSLGLSNESHWAGLDLFTNPRFAAGLVRQEIEEVIGPFGPVFLAAGILLRPRASPLVTAWIASAWIFYVAAIRTSSESWASYYHVISVAPAALLAAHGFDALRRLRPGLSRTTRSLLALAFAANALLLFAHAIERHRHRFHGGVLLRAAACRDELQSVVPSDARIVFPGGNAFDEDGHPIAFDVSWMFYFLDRKGFTLPVERWNGEALDEIAGRGGRFVFLKKSTERERPDWAAAIRERAAPAADCGDYLVFDLGTRPVRSGAAPPPAASAPPR